MNSFIFHNPTKIIFGRNSVVSLAEQIKNYNKILFAYGGGSIKRNGLYDSVVSAFRQNNTEFYELKDIMPNPRKQKVYEGIELCKQHGIELILAVGGGSVIDCCKAIAAGACTDKDFWQTFFIDGDDCEAALPLASILTLSATGSEMNSGCVISDYENNIKTAYGSPKLYPIFSILDPIYTYTLPREQTVYGAVDILAHIFEQYFSPPDESNLSDDIAEAITKNVINNLEFALENPQNYRARANLMWDSTMALNGIIRAGKRQDWRVHAIEHALSAHFDIAHGAGLSIVYPNYMRYVFRHSVDKYARFARNVWGISEPVNERAAIEGIEKTKAYFKRIGAPTTLGQVGIAADDINKLVDSVELYDGGYIELTKNDIRNILVSCL